MFDKEKLDLLRVDIFSPADDEIVDAIDGENVPLAVDSHYVAGVLPAAAAPQLLERRAVIFRNALRAAVDELALAGTGNQLVWFCVYTFASLDDAHFLEVAGFSYAFPLRLRLQAGVTVSNSGATFRGSIRVEHLATQRVADTMEQRLGEWGAAAAHKAQRRYIEVA